MMLPIQTGLRVWEAYEDRVITASESTQIMTTVFNGVVGAMMIAFGMMMVNNVIRSNPKHPPKPVARVVTVPGGSHWLCAKCGIGLEPGSEAVKMGAKTYCVPCARGGNPGSGVDEFVNIELGRLVSAYGYRPTGVSFEGRNVMGDAVGAHLGGFVFLCEDLKEYWDEDKERAEVLIRHTVAHEYYHLKVLYEGEEKYLPADIEEESKEEYLEGYADGFAAKWAGFTVFDVDKISEMIDEFCRFRERRCDTASL